MKKSIKNMYCILFLIITSSCASINKQNLNEETKCPDLVRKFSSAESCSDLYQHSKSNAFIDNQFYDQEINDQFKKNQKKLKTYFVKIINFSNSSKSINKTYENLRLLSNESQKLILLEFINELSVLRNYFSDETIANLRPYEFDYYINEIHYQIEKVSLLNKRINLKYWYQSEKKYSKHENKLNLNIFKKDFDSLTKEITNEFPYKKELNQLSLNELFLKKSEAKFKNNIVEKIFIDKVLEIDDFAKKIDDFEFEFIKISNEMSVTKNSDMQKKLKFELDDSFLNLKKILNQYEMLNPNEKLTYFDLISLKILSDANRFEMAMKSLNFFNQIDNLNLKINKTILFIENLTLKIDLTRDHYLRNIK